MSMNTDKPPIIAFAGQKGVGKTTCQAIAHRILGSRPCRFSFAKHLKELTYDFVAHLDVPREAFFGDQAAKAFPQPALGGKTGREVLVEVGELFRSYNKDIFATKVFDAVGGGTWPVLVDDLRFRNEARIVREAGGIVVGVRVLGEKMTAVGPSSETEIYYHWAEMIDLEVSAYRGDPGALVDDVRRVLEFTNWKET